MAVNMDSELLLKFIGYFLDYLSALSRTLLRFFSGCELGTDNLKVASACSVI